MHLTALVDSTDHVCCRYRVAAFRSLLESAGHRLDVQAFPRSLWGRFRIGADLRDCDAVLLQRRLLPGWQLSLLRRRVRRLLFDLDDAVFLRDSYSPRGIHDPRRLRRFTATVRACSGVLAGNEWLAAAVREAAPGVPVHVIPTCVDPARYHVASHDEKRHTDLVWIGSSSTLQGLTAIAPMLEEIGRACPGVRLKVVCDRFPRFDHLPIVERRWSEESEAQELASADIGIAWVPDDDWSRGKCGLKVLQYMAARLPVIANPVGVQAEMVRHGESGFLATTRDEWVDAVRVLAADPDLRKRMGAAGRQRVEREFSVAAGAARWLGVLQSLPLAA